MPLLNDEEVMVQIQSGRVEMLALLFERHHVRLYNFFLRLTFDRCLSEDLVQETFLRILKYSGSFRYEAKFSTWMYQIARHLHIDHLHKSCPETPLEEIGQTLPAAPAVIGADIERDQERELLQRAMARLPLKNREVILLSRFQGMKHADIAVILGCSANNVKVQVHRSLAKLRRIYLELSGGVT